MADTPKSSRRAFLGGAVMASAVAGDVSLAQDKARRDDLLASDPGPGQVTRPHYHPSFFTPAEWMFVLAACDRLIPRDEVGPGAVELGVPEYIDRALQTPYGEAARWYMDGPFVKAEPEFGYQSKLTPKQQYRLGIRATEAYCTKTYGKAFADLSLFDQETVLKRMEGGEIKDASVDLKSFFSAFLLKNTTEGYFGDPMYGGNKDMAAWKMIGYPGVRGDFTAFVQHRGAYPYGPVSLHGRDA